MKAINQKAKKIFDALTEGMEQYSVEFAPDDSGAEDQVFLEA